VKRSKDFNLAGVGEDAASDRVAGPNLHLPGMVTRQGPTVLMRWLRCLTAALAVTCGMTMHALETLETSKDGNLCGKHRSGWVRWTRRMERGILGWHVHAGATWWARDGSDKWIMFADACIGCRSRQMGRFLHRPTWRL